MAQKFSIQHQPGFIFTRTQKRFRFPHQLQYEKNLNSSLPYHQASKTEKVYSGFGGRTYRPPHLNSSQSSGLIHKGQCRGWQINRKKNPIPPPHLYADKNYDDQYAQYEHRVRDTLKGYERVKYDYVGSKIKYLVDEDKPLMPTQVDYNYDHSESENQEDQIMENPNF